MVVSRHYLIESPAHETVQFSVAFGGTWSSLLNSHYPVDYLLSVDLSVFVELYVCPRNGRKCNRKSRHGKIIVTCNEQLIAFCLR